MPELRRSGTVTELLFLYECVTDPPARLQPIGERLGVTVQAASQAYRRLRASGLVEFRDGRYRATVTGIDWLHRALGGFRDDIEARLRRLHVIRSSRAVALGPLRKGDRVALEMQDGVLSARPGLRGRSLGRAAEDAATGALVAVDQLEGIVPIQRGRIRVLTVDPGRVEEGPLTAALRRQLDHSEPGLLAAQGLEPYHLLRRATDRPIARFAVGATAAEAAELGVSSTVVVLADDLPRFLEQFSEPNPPAIDVRPLGAGPMARRSGGRSGSSGRERDR